MTVSAAKKVRRWIAGDHLAGRSKNPPSKKGFKSKSPQFRGIPSNITLMENRHYGIVIVDAKTFKILFANARVRKAIGSAKNEVKKRSILSIIVPEDRERFAQAFRARLAGKRYRSSNRYTVIRKDGVRIIVEAFATPILYNGKECLQGLTRNVTAEVLLEKSLRENEQRFRNLVENSGYGFYIADFRTRKLLYLNKYAQNLLGKSGRRWQEFDFLDLFTPADQAQLMDLSRMRKAGQINHASGEHRVQLPNGKTLWVEFESSLVDYGGRSCIQGIFKDITRHKEADEQLRESEEKYRSVIDNIGIGISLISPQMRILSLNNQMRKWFPAIDPERRPICYKSYNRPPRQKICSYCPTAKTLKDGLVHESVTETPAGKEVRNYRVISSPIKDKDGRIMAAIEMVEDITARKQVEEELIKERDRFKLVFEHLPVMALAFDDTLNLIALNKTCERITGYRKSELVRNPKALALLSRDSEHVLEISQRLLGKPATADNWEWHIRTKRGEIRTIAWSSVSRQIPVPGFAIWGIGLDITEKKKAEMDLRNQRDLLREVTGEIIKVQEEERRRISMELHDSIGQSLSLTKLQIQNVQKSVEHGSGDIISNLQAISKIISDTITDLRQISANLRPVILDNLGLLPTIEWYLRDFAKRTNLLISMDIGGGELHLSPQSEAHLFRVIQEIMINIQKHSSAQRVSFKSYLHDSEIVFEVHEDGVGFDPQDIFEPSTRRRGMGLINIMERVKLVGGRLDIHSTPKKGVSFTVAAPCGKRR